MPTNTDRKLRVFLCHSSQDKPIVRELYQRLSAEGWIDPWLDEEKLLPGQDWDMEIEKAVESADAVIVCLSDTAVHKVGYVQKELRKVLDIADEQPEGMIFIIPICFDSCEIPRRLSSWQYVDYFPETRQNLAYGRLLDSLTLKANMVGFNIDAATQNSVQGSRLRELLDSGIVASSAVVEVESTLDQTVQVTKRILRARFVYVSISDLNRVSSLNASAGIAPKILSYLSVNLDENVLFRASKGSLQATRMLDIRKLDSKINLDAPNLQSFMTVPLRLHRLSIGSILIFGKEGGTSFSEEDELLASFISIQTCAAIESIWLSKELTSTLSATATIYRLSARIIQIDKLDDALIAITDAARKLSRATSGGIVLLNSHSEVETVAVFDPSGVHFGMQYPVELVKNAMESKQTIITSTDRQTEICLPVQTQYRRYGAIWLNIQEEQFSFVDLSSIQTLVVLTSVSLERYVLLRETHQQVGQSK
ncbi:MAG: TIR domain-containing protein [Anaerolineales bacterium]|nr:TIR domain-containing protein [Anaerolineales bacterium]